MSRIMRLECFDMAPEPVVPGPSDDWVAGHAEGYAAGRAEAVADQAALRAATAQALADLTLSAREAQNLVLGRLAPLFDVIARQVLPDILHQTLGHHLQAAMETAAQTDARADLVILAPEVEVAAITSVVTMIAGAGVVVRADRRLAPGQILLSQGDRHSCLDPGQLSRDIAAALAALSVPTQRQESHG